MCSQCFQNFQFSFSALMESRYWPVCFVMLTFKSVNQLFGNCPIIFPIGRSFRSTSPSRVFNQLINFRPSAAIGDQWPLWPSSIQFSNSELGIKHQTHRPAAIAGTAGKFPYTTSNAHQKLPDTNCGVPTLVLCRHFSTYSQFIVS